MRSSDPAERARALVLVAIGAGLASLLIHVLPESRWDPLDTYPEQVAPGLVVGRPGEPPTVTVAARKCARETAEVFGSVTWQRITPPGHSVSGPEGQSTRVAGCSDFTYRNPIPEQVWADVCALGESVWRIVGVETPFRDGGTGEPQRWRSSDVRLRCEPTS